MTDQEKIDAVTAKLTGELHVGQQVRVLVSGRIGRVLKIREDAGSTWVRVKLGASHWEYHRIALEPLT